MQLSASDGQGGIIYQAKSTQPGDVQMCYGNNGAAVALPGIW